MVNHKNSQVVNNLLPMRGRVFLTPNLIWFVSTVLGRCSFLRDLCFEAVRLTRRVSEQIGKLSAVAVSQPDHNLLRAVTHLTT